MSDTPGPPPPEPPPQVPGPPPAEPPQVPAPPPDRRVYLYRRAGAALIAVAAVTGGIVLVNLLSGPSTNRGGPPASPSTSRGGGPGPSVPGSPTGALSPPATGTVPPGTVPPGSVAAPGGPLVGEPDRSAPPVPGGASGPAGPGAGSSTGAGPPTGARSAGGRAFAPVVVYNNSRLAGLGARAATVVRAAGFEVKLVSGLPARVSATTVYYDPPDQAAAQTLIGLVPGIARALPRPSWLLRTGTLILVVTRDFPVDP